MSENTIAARIAQTEPDSEADRPRTLIIGAGVAGLTLAALMRQRGETPVVIERDSSSLGDKGYMLGLYPLGARVLHGLGLYDDYRAKSVSMHRYRIGDGKGNIIRSYSLRDVTRRYGPIQGISRAALIELLHKKISDLLIHYGTTVQALDQREQEVNVTFSDGSSHRFDLVAAADGLHSATRAMILDDDAYSYQDTGWGGWVFWTDPGLAPEDTYTEYWGAGHFLGLYPAQDRLGVFIGGPVEKAKQMGLARFAKHVQEHFDPPPPPIRDVEDLPSDAFFWTFHDCRSQNWRKGRVVLLGDAAVGFLPTAGVGASMAMESAAALSDELSRANAARVEQALDLYEKRHRERVEKAQKSSRQMGRMMFVNAAPMAWMRNQLVQFYTAEQLVKSIATIMDEPI